MSKSGNEVGIGSCRVALLSVGLLALVVAFVAGRFSVNTSGRLTRGEMYQLMDCACSRGDVYSVQFLLNAGADAQGVKSYEDFMNESDAPFEPMWHPVQAAFCGSEEVLGLLLKSGANPNMPCGENYTPLVAASSRGHLASVLMLIEAHADLNAICHDGNRTALDMARDHGHAEVVSALVRAGAKSAKDLK